MRQGPRPLRPAPSDTCNEVPLGGPAVIKGGVSLEIDDEDIYSLSIRVVYVPILSYCFTRDLNGS
jgi:hypothetical protein